MMFIFHAVQKRVWQKSLKSNQYGDYLIEKDGFIHCSKFEQMEKIANTKFKNIDSDFLILCINTYYLKSELKWENDPKSGDIYPHIYGPINFESIVKELEIKRKNDGSFLFPKEFFDYSKYEKSCGAVIGHKFDNDYKFLLIGFKFKGKLVWGFPKGHVEDGETELMTAEREIKEEVGISAGIIPNRRANTYFSCKKGITQETVYYAALSDSSKVKCQKGEVDEYVWCEADDVCDYLSFECDKQIFRELKSFFGK